MSTCLHLQLYEKSYLQICRYVCKEGKGKFALTSFLSNAVLLVKWMENMNPPTVSEQRTSEESMAVEKLDYFKGRRHLRGMKFVQMRRKCMHLSAAWLVSHCITLPLTGLIVNLIGLIIHSEMFSLCSLMQLGERPSSVSSSYVQMLGRSSLPWLIFS